MQNMVTIDTINDQKNTAFRPFASAILEINKIDAVHPAKYDDPINPMTGLGKHIMSSWVIQLCKLVLISQSVQYSKTGFF